MNNMIDHYVNGEKLYAKIVAPVCDTYGLTYMELTILLFLANNPQHDTATAIVKYRHLTKSHVSTSLHSLQEKRLLTGEYRDNNRRTIHLKLTPLSHPIIEDGRQAQQQFREMLMDGFTPEEKLQFNRLVDRIDRNIKAHTKSIKGE